MCFDFIRTLCVLILRFESKKIKNDFVVFFLYKGFSFVLFDNLILFSRFFFKKLNLIQRTMDIDGARNLIHPKRTFPKN